jgi:hypothetical protein
MVLTDRLVRLGPGVHDRWVAGPAPPLVDLAEQLIEVRGGVGVENTGRGAGLSGGRIGRERRCRCRQGEASRRRVSNATLARLKPEHRREKCFGEVGIVPPGALTRS